MDCENCKYYHSCCGVEGDYYGCDYCDFDGYDYDDEDYEEDEIDE